MDYIVVKIYIIFFHIVSEPKQKFTETPDFFSILISVSTTFTKVQYVSPDTNVEINL